MSISSIQAAGNASSVQVPVAQEKPAPTDPVSAAPAVSPVPKVPAIKAEPLVDPEQVRENLHAAIEQLNQQIERNGRGLNFSVDERLNRQIITVTNTATGEVVRTIPTDVVINVAHNIEDIKGLLLDQTT
jgi:flagellar protein FlaG